jgi:hypothetical protein
MRFDIPQQGDTHTQTRFAFFPTKVGSQIVWLERYKETHIYSNGRWIFFYRVLM